MAIPNSVYWAGRMKITSEALLDQGYAYTQNLETQFDRAVASIDKDISAWYQRFADNNAISYTEARKWLAADELKEFHWTVEEYIKRGQENALSSQWIKQLENASAKVHISRLDALKLQIQQQAELLHGGQLDSLDTLLGRVYTDGYYRTAYEIQRGIGTGWTLHSLNADTVGKVLSRPWTTDMQTFRDRVWTNKQTLVGSVNTHLTQMIIRGEGAQKAISAVAHDMGVAKHKAARLVMTESAYFSAAAQKDCFNGLGVERYVIIATLDGNTCPLCGSMDGKVFKMSEYAEGLTAPPFHPWCRDCTAPWFEDMADLGQRARRDPGTGKTVTDVPRGMKYGEWKEKFVQPEPPKSGLTTADDRGIVNLGGVVDVLKIGEITPAHFGNIFPVLTNDVVITERQIAHIKERHPQDYERYARYIPKILKEPDYILEANKPDSAVLLKEFVDNGEYFRLILRLKAVADPDEYQNSVISFWRIDKSRYRNYIRNKKVLYKAE